MKWKCKIEFEEPVVGNLPADPKQLIHAIRKRLEEQKIKYTEEELKKKTERELEELYPTEEPQILTFYSDESGLYIKDMNIVGMIKERIRQLGLSRERGIISAVEGLRITHKIYLKRNGEYIKKPEDQIAKPITTWRGGVVTIADIVKPPVEMEFEIELSKLCKSLKPEMLEEILKECSRLLGLRKEYGLFKWVKFERVDKS